ncbi:MAG: MFS transporter [Chloroflexi bacterium]|nr:MAG: MFS transporter [Chloroflexota bacterium]
MGMKERSLLSRAWRSRSDDDRANVGPTAPASRYTLLVLTVSLGGILAPLNSTMLAVALPDLRRDFGIGHAEIAWLVSAYLIAMAVAQPLGGRLGDQLGRARVFRAGLVLFLGLSLAAAASPGYAWLIVFRTGQALVGAAVIPNGLAMLRESVPLNRLGRSGGTTGAAMSSAAAIGPLLGAGLLGLGSWRLLFLMNVPLVALALLALYRLAPSFDRGHKRVSLDWLGAAAFAGLLFLVTVLLNALRGDAGVLILVTAAVAFPLLLLGFLRQQFSAVTPIAEWRLFRIRSYAGATAYILLSNLVMYTIILAVPFFVREVQGKGSFTTGLLLGAVSVPVALIAPVGGRISDEAGRRPPIIGGSVLVVAGITALLFGISSEAPFLFLASILCLIGVGLGFSVGPASAAAIESTPAEFAGTAAGTNSMMRYVGSIIGAGVLGSVLNTNEAAPGVDLFRLIFAVLVVVAVLGALSSLLVHRFPRSQEEMAEVQPAPALAPADW